jgi:hypothetical protein
VARQVPLARRGTSESSPISTLGRPRSPSGCSSIPRRSTRSVRSMRARPPWTGCPRSRSAVSPLPPLLRPARGAIIESTSSIRPGTWTSRRGRAQPARPRRRGRRLRRRGRRRAPVRDGLAPGGQVQRAAHLLHQQARPHRCRLLALRGDDQGPPRSPTGSDPAPDRHRGQVHRHRGPDRHEGDRLQGRGPRRRVGDDRHPGRPGGEAPRSTARR